MTMPVNSTQPDQSQSQNYAFNNQLYFQQNSNYSESDNEGER